jgi:hypothetical protein
MTGCHIHLAESEGLFAPLTRIPPRNSACPLGLDKGTLFSVTEDIKR